MYILLCLSLLSIPEREREGERERERYTPRVLRSFLRKNLIFQLSKPKREQRAVEKL